MLFYKLYSQSWQSVTSGKAGGLIGEPLKAVIVSRSKRRLLFEHFHLIRAFVCLFLLPNIIADRCLVSTNR